jgi:hypothetical protein
MADYFGGGSGGGAAGNEAPAQSANGTAGAVVNPEDIDMIE